MPRPGKAPRPSSSRCRAAPTSVDDKRASAIGGAEGEPLFSVLIATYARPDYLREAVASVLEQTVDDLECIVVDDAGHPPARVPDDSRVRLVRRAVNGGQAASYNTGLAHARGRYLAFLDDDDRYTPERLAIALEGFKRAPLVVCRSRVMGQVSRGRSRPRRTLEGDVSAVIRDQMTPIPGQTAVERPVALPFDERFRASTDVEWWIRMAQQVRVATVDRTGLLYRRHEGVRYINDRGQRVRDHLMMLEVHADYFAAHPRGAAFHLQQIGARALRTGDYSTATSVLVRSLMRRPGARTLWHLGLALGAGARAGLRPH